MERPKDKPTAVQMQQQPGSVLEELAREGARRMLARALEVEVTEFVDKHRNKIDAEGRRQVVRNGYMPARDLVTGIGALMIRQPRLDDRVLKEGGEERFRSAILPRYLRRVPSVDNLIPILYLKGITQGTCRGPSHDSGLGGCGTVGYKRRSAESPVGAGLPAVVSTRSKGQTIRVHVGRWEPCQRSPRRREELHPGNHGS